MTRKYSETTKNVLLCVAAVGVIVIAATSPYFLLNIARGILRNKKYFKAKTGFDEKRVARTLRRLEKNQLIILDKKREKVKVELTEEGKREVMEIQLSQARIREPKKWDKKWRVIIFDIPDKYKRKARDALREKLKELNFCQLQKSVWVHPYPCEKVIQALCEVFDITSFVNILIVEKIYDDIKLREHFRFL